MAETINIKTTCPVCKEMIIINQGLHFCSTCGWQTKLSSVSPPSNRIQELNNRRDLKQANFETLRQIKQQINKLQKQSKVLVSKLPDAQNRLEKLKGIRNNLNDKLNQLIGGDTGIDENITSLEEKVNSLRNGIEKLEEVFSEEEITTNFHLDCNYNKKENVVEVRVAEVFDRFLQLSQEILFAVAFSSSPILSIHDAEVVIPTESKKILYPKEGESYRFQLKHNPPKHLIESDHQQIVHLIANSLTKYTII